MPGPADLRGMLQHWVAVKELNLSYLDGYIHIYICIW